MVVIERPKDLTPEQTWPHLTPIVKIIRRLNDDLINLVSEMVKVRPEIAARDLDQLDVDIGRAIQMALLHYGKMDPEMDRDLLYSKWRKMINEFARQHGIKEIGND